MRPVLAVLALLLLVGCVDADPHPFDVGSPSADDLAGSDSGQDAGPVADAAPSADASSADDVGSLEDSGEVPPEDTVQPTEDTGAPADDASPPGDSIEGPTDTGDGTQVIGLAQAQALYGTYCAFCHGDMGEGYVADGANALSNPLFLSTASDDFIRSAITDGRPGTPMSAWSIERGGPLTGTEVEALVKLIRGWQTELTVLFPDDPVEGVAERAQPIWDVHCASCHGADGMGGDFPSVANPVLLQTATDDFLRYSIAKGRTGTPMPAYEALFTVQAIDDLVTLIRSWQVDPEAPPAVTPNDDAPAVINPDGPEPDLGEARLVPCDTVYAAYELGAKMVLLDARPGGDYVTEHIAGAISVPFYAVEQHLDRLPKDTWIVAYCACPHAESELAADALEAAGYDKVRVLDEGFLEWKERLYPVSSGADP